MRQAFGRSVLLPPRRRTGRSALLNNLFALEVEAARQVPFVYGNERVRKTHWLGARVGAILWRACAVIFISRLFNENSLLMQREEGDG